MHARAEPVRAANASSQTCLSFDSVTMFEQPLNERIRSFLRLETLFDSIRVGIERDGTWDARHAIIGMIEISDQLARVDIKGELIKEIERHASTLTALRDNPRVNQATLEHTMARLEPILSILKSPGCQPGARLRHSELANQIKQRLAIPGGTCSFDLPALHYWLHRAPRHRSEQLQAWMGDLRIVEDAIATVLKLVRDSAIPQLVTAENGFYQHQLEANSACQLVRLAVAAADEVYPEISGGKHRFAVRFVRNADVNSRARQVQQSVPFELHCCML